jgi:hypothetical protein
MLRYLLIAICSGIVERVFWWRLAAFGYGLVDDSDAEQWRERPAYKMLKEFLAWVGAATFEKRLELGDKGAVAFEFSESGKKFWLAYTSGTECEVEFPAEITRAEDAMGEKVEIGDGRLIKLSGRVVCLRG